MMLQAFAVIFTALNFSTLTHANELKLHVFSAPKPIAWNSVNGLFYTSLKNSFFDKIHPIGHFSVDINCDQKNEFGINRVLTGMTRENAKEANRTIIMDGVGLDLHYHVPGRLQNSEEVVENIEWMTTLERHDSISIPISDEKCQQMLSFMGDWIKNGSYHVYSFATDTEHGEGAGCSDFAEHFYKIATGKNFPESWIIRRKIPLHLIGSKTKKIPFLKILLRHQWAKTHEAFVDFRVVDPTLAFEHMDDLKEELKTKNPSTTSINPIFTYQYPTKVEAKNIWEQIQAP